MFASQLGHSHHSIYSEFMKEKSICWGAIIGHCTCHFFKEMKKITVDLFFIFTKNVKKDLHPMNQHQFYNVSYCKLYHIVKTQKIIGMWQNWMEYKKQIKEL